MAKGKTPKHTACHPGKRVVIKLRTGSRFVDVFVERRKGALFFKEHGRVDKSDIESFAVYKHRPA